MNQRSRGLSFEAAELGLESPFGELVDAIEDSLRALGHRLWDGFGRNALAVVAFGLLLRSATKRG